MAEMEGQLSQHILGLEPYILIRVVSKDEGENLNVEFETGGGFSQKTGVEFLKAVIESAEEN